ncbi:MAG TPA: radical SAM protein [Desulfomonilia bacterium]|nr:radical SAM protein [Desulfomonilia bacterium]
MSKLDDSFMREIGIGKNGELQVPDDLRRRWDISPGKTFRMEETPQGLQLIPLEPPLRKIYLEPTSRCNLSCRTCMRNSWDEPIGSMEMSVYRKLITDLSEVPSCQSMAFWGIGEPLVHPGIVDMVGLAHDAGLKTELITNSLLLDRDMARGMIEAGLDTLVVSLDGTTEATYAGIRTGGDLGLVQENIRGLNRLRARMFRSTPEVGLEFVAMRSNVDQLPDLARIARNLEAAFIVVTNLLPCTPDMKDEILYWLSAQVKNTAQRSQWYPELVLPRIDLRSEYHTPLFGLQRRTGRIVHTRNDTPEDDYCPFIREGSTSITWAGEVSPCIALMHSYLCYVLGRAKSIRRFSMGNIAGESIADIWNKEEYRTFRSRVIGFDFSPCIQCSGCEYTDTNEEDCYGNPHPVCGDCLWSKRILLCP